MRGFSDQWKDFPDYIIGITKEIWEDRGVGPKIRDYYGKDVIVRMPGGISTGVENSPFIHGFFCIEVCAKLFLFPSTSRLAGNMPLLYSLERLSDAVFAMFRLFLGVSASDITSTSEIFIS